MKSVIMPVEGSYKVCGVIGKPIAHTLSPTIHNVIAKMLGEKSIYVPFCVEEEKLQAAVLGAHALGVTGLNVTMPHKQSIMQYMVELDETAKKVGAVNTLVYNKDGYIGYNTDAYGLKMALETADMQYVGKNVAIIGSGGAAYAAVVALNEASCIHIYNRTVQNAKELKLHMKQFFPSLQICVHSLDEVEPVQYELVIQTTGVGMGQLEGFKPSCSEQLLEHTNSAFDMIYNPKQTSFLKLANKKGCRTANGFEMLFYQAIRAYELMHQIELKEESTLKIRSYLKEVLDI